MTGKETVSWSFGSGMDGVARVAALTDAKGTLYGITTYGAGYGYSRVATIKP
jgi:hypothetical protein